MKGRKHNLIEKMNQRDAIVLAKKIAVDSDNLKKMIRSAHENGSIIDGPIMDDLKEVALRSISNMEIADSYLHTFQKVGKKNYRYFPTSHIVEHCSANVVENKVAADVSK